MQTVDMPDFQCQSCGAHLTQFVYDKRNKCWLYTCKHCGRHARITDKAEIAALDAERERG